MSVNLKTVSLINPTLTAKDVSLCVATAGHVAMSMISSPGTWKEETFS